ncbi:RidA family protein [Pacificimonas sp. WHA3]|uniref:RidA family protein n=1 Tax=Pacificimonas pallii TaxID=2827236 RepID=A0ABS6SBQ1_9SPHN|nr:RidA family protein [Pacificimonas pallii]MBV7255341.1 RidA family protein [Pacificimonas pallii]
MPHHFIQPDNWAPAKGYANGVMTADGRLFIGGQIGWNEMQEFESDDFVAQMEQTLKNILQIVHTAGGKAEDITRLTWYVTSKREYLKRQSEVGAAYRSVLGKHFPAMTMVVISELIEDRAVIEIEATAVIPN